MHVGRFHNCAELLEELVTIFELIEPDWQRVKLEGVAYVLFGGRAKSDIYEGSVVKLRTRCVSDLFHVHYRLIPSN